MAALGCFGAILFLAMAGGGGYGWYATHHFVWWGVVCVIGIIGLFFYALALGAGEDFADGIGDIDFGSFD